MRADEARVCMRAFFSCYAYCMLQSNEKNFRQLSLKFDSQINIKNTTRESAKESSIFILICLLRDEGACYT